MTSDALKDSKGFSFRVKQSTSTCTQCHLAEDFNVLVLVDKYLDILLFSFTYI